VCAFSTISRREHKVLGSTADNALLLLQTPTQVAGGAEVEIRAGASGMATRLRCLSYSYALDEIFYTRAGIDVVSRRIPRAVRKNLKTSTLGGSGGLRGRTPYKDVVRVVDVRYSTRWLIEVVRHFFVLMRSALCGAAVGQSERSSAVLAVLMGGMAVGARDFIA
jgi:hypothetical protein